MRAGETVLILHPVGLELYVALIGMLRAGLVPAIPPPGAGPRRARALRAQAPAARGAGRRHRLGRASRSFPSCVTRRASRRRATPFAHDVLHADHARAGAGGRDRAVRRRRAGDADVHLGQHRRGQSAGPLARRRARAGRGARRALALGACDLAVHDADRAAGRARRRRDVPAPGPRPAPAPRAPTRRCSPSAMRAHGVARIVASPGAAGEPRRRRCARAARRCRRCG